MTQILISKPSYPMADIIDFVVNIFYLYNHEQNTPGSTTPGAYLTTSG